MKARRRRRRRRGDHQASRDQRASVFASILNDLVARVPGARAAALVDLQGETVDYAGRTTPFDVRVTAAHLRIVLFEAHTQSSLARLRWCTVRAARGSYLISMLPEGYALVVVLARAAGFVGWRRAVAACTQALAKEACWDRVDSWCEPWFAAEVISDRLHRPRSVKVGGRIRSVEVVGTVVQQGHGERATRSERGWRVRFDTGAETTLVREPGGGWYTDEALEGVVGRGVEKTR